MRSDIFYHRRHPLAPEDADLNRKRKKKSQREKSKANQNTEALLVETNDQTLCGVCLLDLIVAASRNWSLLHRRSARAHAGTRHGPGHGEEALAETE